MNCCWPLHSTILNFGASEDPGMNHQMIYTIVTPCTPWVKQHNRIFFMGTFTLYHIFLVLPLSIEKYTNLSYFLINTFVDVKFP
jgi:hypothetical protein